jgi:3-oxocholest-4-en-26-oate---CoA ligase
LMHGGGQWTAVAALLGGNTVVLPTVVDHLDAADIWRTVETEQVSLLAIAGNAFAAPLLEELDRPSGYDLTSLRIVVSGAVAFGTELKSRMLDHLPWVTIIDNGGSSETGAQMELRTSSKSHAESGVFEARPGTLLVSDDLSGVIAAGSGEVGWLARQGRVPLGYLFDEHATVMTFPIVQGNRFSITGDRATVLADGRIAFQGRDAMTINTGGEKVHAEEVEAAIASHGTVADVVVVGSPSERWGSEVTAIIQWRPGCVATLADLRSHAGNALASYKLPRRLLAVDRIRRLDSGKVDYRWAVQVTRTHHDRLRSTPEGGH